MKIVCSRPFEASHPSALAIYCSDGRFTDAVRELALALGHKRHDAMCVPGGAATLTSSWTNRVIDAEAALRETSFLIAAHAIADVLLIAHWGCGYYRNHYPKIAPERIHEIQIADLARASELLLGAHSVRVASFYARVGAVVEFEPLSEQKMA